MKKLTLILSTLLLTSTLYAQIGGGIFGPPNRPRTATFANLGTPVNGDFRWCSDCVAASPCAGSGTGAFAYRVGGAWNCTTGATSSGATYLAADGTAAAPSYSFASTGNSDNGMYLFGANALGFVTAGTDRWVINASGALVAATDGGVDIGNGAADPRDLSLRRNLILRGSTSGKITFAAAATTTDYTYTWPNAAPASPSTMFPRGDGTWATAGGSYTALTAGALTVSNDGSNGKPFVATYNAALVATIGGVAAGDLKVATLPAKTFIRNVFLVITAPDAGFEVMTVSIGRVGATYIDYIVASNHIVAANTVYGNAAAERGTNNTSYDLPSYSATTDVYVRFDVTGSSAPVLSGADGVAGVVVIDYTVIP